MTRSPRSQPSATARRVAGTGLRATLAVLLATSLVAGCTAPTDDDGAPSPSDAPDGGDDGGGTEDGGGAGTDGGGTIGAGLDDEVALAVADAAAGAGVSEASITVRLAEAVTWSDGSLGCPAPGMAYTQALVEGYRIELEVGATTIAYHGARGSAPFPCRDPEPPVEGGRG